MRVFVSGGARSGKSAYAEALVRHYQARQPGKRYYLATAAAGDREMARRIARHRRDRGAGWITLEVSLDLLDAVTNIEPGSSVLLDCLTLWASQVRYASPLSEEEALAMLRGVLEEARTRRLKLVLVSNDINQGMPMDDPAVQGYQHFLERVHREVIAGCMCAVQVVAGVPIYWKGHLLNGDE